MANFCANIKISNYFTCSCKSFLYQGGQPVYLPPSSIIGYADHQQGTKFMPHSHVKSLTLEKRGARHFLPLSCIFYFFSFQLVRKEWIITNPFIYFLTSKRNSVDLCNSLLLTKHKPIFYFQKKIQV